MAPCHLQDTGLHIYNGTGGCTSPHEEVCSHLLCGPVYVAPALISIYKPLITQAKSLIYFPVTMKISSHISMSLLLVLSLITGCSTPPPAGVEKSGVSHTYQQINISALNSSRLSSYSRIVLDRHDLNTEYKRNVIQCINKLHLIAENDDRNDIRLALSEICFQAAVKERKYKIKNSTVSRKGCYVAATIYAYRYILSMNASEGQTIFSREFRLACDIYNRSISAALVDSKNTLTRTSASLRLPVGHISISTGYYGLPLPLKKYKRFEPADKYTVRGLSTRNRNGGIGAPLLVIQHNPDNLPIGTVAPATLLLRFDGNLKALREGKAKATVDIINTLSQQTVLIDGYMTPLEIDVTTPLAYTLERTDLWYIGKKMFRLGKISYPSDIYTQHTYEKGKIPVVFVHGTMSSFVWWSEMLNTLYSYAEIRNNFQFWFFLYDSGKPTLFSTRELREAIQKKIKECDPNNTDSAMQNMVVIGHSQGGSLTRLLTIDSGEMIINTLTGKNIDELNISEKEKKKVIKLTVLKPMPSIKRVIYMSTPHRGSFRANSLTRKLTRWFIKLPQNVIETLGSLENLLSDEIEFDYLKKYNTSVDSMSPDNIFLHNFAKMPTADGIKAHSIIAIDGDEHPPDGDDGVVKYTSAHLDGVESEFIVRSGHSSQLEPSSIEEVRRILLKHLKETNKTTKPKKKE